MGPFGLVIPRIARNDPIACARVTVYSLFIPFCFSASSIISNHIAFNTANAAAKGNPNSQAKYHIIKLLE
jgi:hypothetical protein